MRAKTLLAVLFLISIGVCAIVLLRAMSTNLNARAGGPEALVAADNLQPGTLLRAQDVEWRPLPRAAVVPGIIIRPTAAQRQENPLSEKQVLAEVFGAALRIGLTAREPIRQEVIVRPGDRDFLRMVLTPGERAISIPVKTGGASTGLLEAGDHVDVILTQRFNEHSEPMARRSVAETVVEDLRVLVVDTPDQKAKLAAGRDAFGRTVTLEVTPSQAQKITVASELGKLLLTLRPSAAQLASAKPAPNATWAGDVSPALGDVSPPAKVVADPPAVAVIRGNKPAVLVKQH